MTERGRRTLARSAEAFRLGRSLLRWDDGGLEITLDESTTPGDAPIRGRLRLTPRRGGGPSTPLDGEGLHHWRPIAPDCEAELSLTHPGQRWRGHGYVDTNWGARPIAADFTGWDWSRSCGADPAAFYELQGRDGSRRAFCASFAPDGAFRIGGAAAHHGEARSFWRLPRRMPGEAGAVIGTLEDTPFYARTLASARIDGAETLLIHERLDCRRLSRGWVQALLPFRMPREP